MILKSLFVHWVEQYVMNKILTSNNFYVDRNAIFVLETSRDRIIQTIEQLDKSNQLLEILIFKNNKK